MAEVIDWPVDLIPGEMSLGLESMTRSFESPWTGSVQTVETTGSKVVMQVSFKEPCRAPLVSSCWRWLTASRAS